VATLDGTDPDRDTEAGELVDRPSSSSFGLSSDEISTVRAGTRRCWLESSGGGAGAGGRRVLPYNARKTQAQKESGSVGPG
jgi:hypothetical protein